ncbi:hypothetical protein FGB62_470g03 [Gracilaria domingensis]|nr:hypothetical protein FGB62_470g03 [Gracilaria domingensis]
MQDAPAPVKETPSKRKRKKILKEVLRSEKINRSALRNLNANNLHATQAQQPTAKPPNSAPVSHAEHSAQTRCSERGPTRQFSEESVVLTGEEQLEEVDISHCSEAEKQFIRETEHNKKHPLMTHLMDDGRCFVRIVRADGAVDYYTLYPHDEAQHQYYEHTY